MKTVQEILAAVEAAAGDPLIVSDERLPEWLLQCWYARNVGSVYEVINLIINMNVGGPDSYWESGAPVDAEERILRGEWGWKNPMKFSSREEFSSWLGQKIKGESS